MAELRPDSFWATVDPADRSALREAGRSVTFARCAPVLSHGGPPDRVLILLTGRVRVLAHTEDGRVAALGERGPGDIVGELGVLRGSPRTAAVVAVTAVSALAVDGARFRSLVGVRPELAARVFAAVAARLEQADRQRAATGRPALDRLILLLLELAGDGSTVHIGHEDLRRYVGVSRAQLSRDLAVLRAERLLDTGRGTITIGSPPRLRDRLGSPS